MPHHLPPIPVFRIRIPLIRIRIQHFRLNTDPDPGFDDQNWKNLQLQKIIYFLDQKLQFTWPKDSRKDVKASEEVFSTQKRTSSISKHEIS